MESSSSRQHLEGRVAIVTGGTSGLGRAACAALAREGAVVTVVGRSRRRLSEVTRHLRERYDCPASGLTLDVRSESDVGEMARRTLADYGRIDVLITSAGILRPPGLGLRTLAQTSLETWDAVIDTNLKGTFLSIRAVLEPMIRQGSGEILTISSKSGRRGLAFDAAYCASKFGIIGLTDSVAAEVRSRGVRVQCLLPGEFDTNLWDQNVSFGRPQGLPPPERVANLMVHMITRPKDTFMPDVLAEPLEPLQRPAWGATP